MQIKKHFIMVAFKAANIQQIGCFVLPLVEFYVPINFDAMCVLKVDLDVSFKVVVDWFKTGIMDQTSITTYVTLLATLRPSFSNSIHHFASVLIEFKSLLFQKSNRTTIGT